MLLTAFATIITKTRREFWCDQEKMTSQAQIFLYNHIVSKPKKKKKDYFLLFTRISVISTRNLLGLTANTKSDLFSLPTQVVKQS